MRVDEHRQHAPRPIRFDEPHSTHVGGQVVNRARISCRLFAAVRKPEVQNEILGFSEDLMPFVGRAAVYRPHPIAVREQTRYKVTADEAPGAGD
jgi:hypothetical protein